LTHEQDQPESATSKGKTARRASGSGRKSAYLLGAASGVAFALFAPMFRPAAKKAIKGGIKVGRYAKKVASNVKEEFEDLAVEAKADLDSEGGPEPVNGQPS
jgi:hypothetical protein